MLQSQAPSDLESRPPCALTPPPPPPPFCFCSDTLLTTPNNEKSADEALFGELGLCGRPAFLPYDNGAPSSKEDFQGEGGERLRQHQHQVQALQQQQYEAQGRPVRGACASAGGCGCS